MKRIIVLIGMVFVFLACTGDFKEINTDKSGVTDEDLQADYNEHGIRLQLRLRKGEELAFSIDPEFECRHVQRLHARCQASEWRFAQFGLQLAGWMEQRHVGTYL